MKLATTSPAVLMRRESKLLHLRVCIDIVEYLKYTRRVLAIIPNFVIYV